MRTLNPRILGQAENAHRALLDHLLNGTGLTYQPWVALTLAASSGQLDRSNLRDRLASALEIGGQTADGVLDDLTAAGLVTIVGGQVSVSDKGATLHHDIKASIDETITAVYSGIPAADLEISGRVLIEITERVNAKLRELASGSAAR